MSDTVKMTFEGVDDLSPTINKINKELNQLDKESQQASKSTDMAGNAIKGMLTAAAGFITIQKLGEALKYSVKEAFEAQKIDARLEQTIKATGGAAGLTAKQISEMASQLQASTTFGDEAIKTGQSLLLTFKNIGGDTFPRATKAMLDMSASMDQDLSTSAQQLGKALNDPVEGLASLSRVGIRFTSDQEAMIKNFVEMGKVSDAQAIILGELEGKFGGVAEAIASTDYGRIEQLKNEISDLAEEIGTALLPVVRGFYETIIDTVEGWKFLGNAAREALDKMAGKQTALEYQQELGEDIKKNTELYNKYNDAMNNYYSSGKTSGIIAFEQGHEMSIYEVQKRMEKYKTVVDGLKSSYDKLYGTNVSKTPSATSTAPTPTKPSGIAEMTQKEIDASNEAWAKAYAEQYGLRLDFQAQMKALREKGVAEEVDSQLSLMGQVSDIDQQILDLQTQLQATEAENDLAVMERRKEGALIAVDTMATATQQIFDAAMTKQITALDKETVARKQNVQDSRMSARQKEKELAKIDEDARKKRYEIALKDWRMNLVMSIANTALGVAKTLATMGYPAGIPLAIAAGATGAVSTGIIAANKPEFAQGGFVQGTSFTGDKVDAAVNSGEAILNTRQQREFMAIANGRSRQSQGNITMGDTTVVINGNATDETVQALRNENMNHRQQIVEMLYEAKERGEIDSTRITL